LSPCLKRGSSIKAGEAEYPCKFVVTVVDGLVVECLGKLASDAVPTASPWAGSEFYVVVEGCCPRVMRITNPSFTIIVAPADP
jgi:hypothetical protein